MPFGAMAQIDQIGLTRIASFVLEDEEKHLIRWILEGP